MPEYARVCQSMPEYARVCKSMQELARVCQSMPEYARVCQSNLPEKASMYAFIHLKLISNLQGFCQYIMADMLNLTIADYRKYSAIVFLGP